MAGPPGKHWTHLEKVFSAANILLSAYVADLGSAVLHTARLKNPSKKIKLTGNPRHPLKYDVNAAGPAADLLAYTFTFTVPAGGFRPPAGQKAFKMFKPESGNMPVFRARIYNRQAGRTITRVGFFSEAFQQEILGIKGKRRQQGMNNALARQVCDAVVKDIYQSMGPDIGIGPRI